MIKPVLADMLTDIEALVTCESPSSDPAAVGRSADLVARIGTAKLGMAPDRFGNDLVWRLGMSPTRVLLLGHHDTVWPVGTLAERPYDVTDGVMTGPGCLDMKAGLVMAIHATATLAGTEGLTLLVTSDEELGSPESRDLIEAEALGCVAALVLEAAADDGALKTERKGVSQYRIRVRGRAAHAGLEPQAGVNTTVEIARHVLALAVLNRDGTTVTPTLLTSGTTSNTVPAYAELAVDVRVASVAEQERIDAAIRSLVPVADGAVIEIDGGPNRPPLTAAASADLFARVRALPGWRGIGGRAVGGASDGNLTAGLGVPTLDGLGAVGGGAHADHEHVLVDHLMARTRLLAALLADLLAALEADPFAEPFAAPSSDAAEPPEPSSQTTIAPANGGGRP